MTAPARVARPTLLWLVSVIAFGAAALSGAGLWGLNAARMAGPVTLVSETDRLDEALGDAPWTASPASGPIVWAFVRPDCPDCGAVDAAGVAALADEDMEIRMVVVASRADQSAPAVALAELRDWEVLSQWVQGEPVAPQTQDRDAAEGYLEWGRASWDRIAAVLRENGVEPRMPLLLWRRGPEWRVLVGAPAASLDSVRRDMAVES